MSVIKSLRFFPARHKGFHMIQNFVKCFNRNNVANYEIRYSPKTINSCCVMDNNSHCQSKHIYFLFQC